MLDVKEVPSLAAGSLIEWSESQAHGWKVAPLACGIEAFKGKTGVIGNYATGYVVVDRQRRPLKVQVFDLKAAITFAENEGLDLADAREAAALKPAEAGV